MNNNKLYNEIVEMLKCYERETGREDGQLEKTLADVNRLRELAAFTACPNIYASAARILVVLRENMDKKASPAGRLSACKQIIKNAPEYRTGIKGVWQENEKYIVCDSYRAVRLDKDLPSLPRAAGVNVSPLLDNCKTYAEELPTPGIGSVKAWIAARGLTRSRCKKTEDAYTPDGWPEYIAIDPFYLLDMLQTFPEDCKVLHAGTAWKPIYFSAPDGDGIIMPVRTPAASAAWNAEQERRRSAADERRSA